MFSSRKRLVKYFLLLFALFFLIWNWKYISWVFNYNMISEGAEIVVDKINPENALPILKFSPLEGNWPPASSSLASSGQVTSTIEFKEANSLDYLTGQHFITIPKLAVTAPIMFTTSTNQKTFLSLLKKGVLHYPGSALPGETGAVVILGHSSSPYWPKVNYDWVFSDLSKLEAGDIITLDFNGQKLQYKVVNKSVLNKGAELKPDLTKSKNMLELVTCWPPGHNRQRMVVEAIQLN
jgi:LPXTG-site transpeptidase (sortase) family protein